MRKLLEIMVALVTCLGACLESTLGSKHSTSVNRQTLMVTTLGSQRQHGYIVPEMLVKVSNLPLLKHELLY